MKHKAELATAPVDINSNIANDQCRYSDVDSGSTTFCSAPTESEDGAPSDINDIQSNIAIVAERMDWPEKSTDRRPSLPTSDISAIAKQAYGRRESFPLIHDNRRTCLPHTSLYQAISFDRLVEKLAIMETDFSKSAGHSIGSVNSDNLISEPRLCTLSPNIEASRITNYHVTTH